MILSGLEISHRRGEVVLQAQVKPEQGRPTRIWFAVEESFSDRIDRSANPFLPTAVTLATAAGEDLRVEAPASATLVRGAERASRLFSDWWGFRPAAVEADGTTSESERGDAVGLFYSGGIDSAATLKRSLDGSIPERVTHLLTLRDLNPHYSQRTERRAWRRTEAAALDYGLPLISLRTNSPDLLRGPMGWSRSFGAALAGSALALGPMIRAQLFGATVDQAYPRPRGSHPELDPLWGTERTTFRHDGGELEKKDRVALLATEPRALRNLKVCWIPDTPGNCGRCFKCLKVMSYFAITGTHEWEASFDRPLDPRSVLDLDLRRGQLGKVTKQIVPALGPVHADLRDAWARRAREVEQFGPRRSLPARAARGLRRRRRRFGRRSARAWRRTRRGVGAVLGRGRS